MYIKNIIKILNQWLVFNTSNITFPISFSVNVFAATYSYYTNYSHGLNDGFYNPTKASISNVLGEGSWDRFSIYIGY